LPVLHGDMNDRPSWCELEHFRVADLAAGTEQVWQAVHRANKLVVVDGECKVTLPGGSKVVAPGDTTDLPAGEHILSSSGSARVVALGGHWGDDCGGVGVFTVDRAEQPGDRGDPVTYAKNTNFDRHYHDCDEYWIIVDGHGTASSEDVLYEVKPGDCVATRMGDHHDLPAVEQLVRGVYFETTMRGQRRSGHLWEHTHGPAKRA
jgi:mannose-6-phosphate isomerase-like protein (cupin superfamily)